MSDAYECLLGVSTASDVGLQAVKQDRSIVGTVAKDIELSPPGALRWGSGC